MKSSRLILDQGVPRDAARLLRSDGFECWHAGEIGLARSSDGEIIARAAAESALVVTLDADFHAILAVTGAATPSVVRIRMQGLNGQAVREIVNRALAVYGSELAAGALVTVRPRKLACHRLPIGAAGTATDD